MAHLYESDVPAFLRIQSPKFMTSLKVTTDTRVHKAVIGRTTSATAIFLALAYLLETTFVAAQAPQPTESVNVLDADSAVVAMLFVPRSSIQTSELAVLINDHDPQSVEIANYYQLARNIPS